MTARTIYAILFCLTTGGGVALQVGAESAIAIDDEDLARRLTALEAQAADGDPEAIRGVVRSFAETMMHARVEVDSARVIATYTREGWKTKPYFAVNYVRDDYVYTEELDPAMQEMLVGHLHWVSVVKSLPDRQLMFELAIDEVTFESLRSQEIISFTCEIAGIIRGGRSVYSRMLSFERQETGKGE